MALGKVWPRISVLSCIVLPGWLDIQLSHTHTHCYTLEQTIYHLIKGLVELMGTVCWKLQPCTLFGNGNPANQSSHAPINKIMFKCLNVFHKKIEYNLIIC